MPGCWHSRLEQVGAIRTLFRQYRNGRVRGKQLRQQFGLDGVHLGLVIGDLAFAAGGFVPEVLEAGGQDALAGSATVGSARLALGKSPPDLRPPRNHRFSLLPT